MNIIVIGSVRTKSTALLSYLHKLHPDHNNWDEFLYPLTLRAGQPIIKDKQKFIISRLDKSLQTIFKSDDNLLKILGSNLLGMYQYIDQLNLKRFHQIHLTERNDFFDQVCSIAIAKKESVYHKFDHNAKLYEKIQTKKYSVSKSKILQTAHDIFNYIKIKQYLLENEINFTQYSYESLKVIEGIPSIPNNLNYKNMIENYFIKEQVNSIFFENFDYLECKTNMELFTKNIDNLLY